MEDLELNKNFITPSFWCNKTVLITGHTGFKGSWLSLWLQQMASKVIGYAFKPPTNPSLFQLIKNEQGMTSIEADIRDYERLKEVITLYRPEIVVHMAAQPLVPYSFHHPLETYATNVMGTVHLLEVIRSLNCIKVIVNVTSDKCYDNKEWVWGYRENESMGGHDPYSSSKGCAELITHAYRDTYFSQGFPALASVRAGNVIGGGDWAQDRLLPDLFCAFIEKRPAIIRNPKAIRPWQHVMEPLVGYLMLIERLYKYGQQYAQAWNFGPDSSDAKPVFWIAERCANLWGKEVSWQVETNHMDLKEAHYLKLDCTKAQTHLGWKPCWQLDVALQKTVEWFKAYMCGEDMRKVTIQQLNEYISERMLHND